jgi:DNA-binding NtrC family response regulator
VFVIDDEGEIADILSSYLREAEFDVETFYDPHSCLRRASQCLPDILVSDICMPGMDGITLAKMLLKLCPHCKVILISGNPDWRTAQKGDDFQLLLKPFSPAKLISLIKSH